MVLDPFFRHQWIYKGSKSCKPASLVCVREEWVQLVADDTWKNTSQAWEIRAAALEDRQ
jgi:hypothetical protein